jgi:hypothetical protein
MIPTNIKNEVAGQQKDEEIAASVYFFGHPDRTR